MLILAWTCLFQSHLSAQSSIFHDLNPIPAPPATFEYQGQWTDFYVPGYGVLTSRDVVLTKAKDGLPGPQDWRQPDQVRLHTVVDKATGTLQVNPLADARNLPLNERGNLLSPDGYEVVFERPDNPNEGGNCATPVPQIVFGPNDRPAANCPLVVPCDNAVNRDAAIPQPTDPIKYIKLNWIVVRDGAGTPTSNIDQARITALMNEVNADFAPFRIQFCADPATFVSDANFYSLNVGTEDGGLKTTYGTTPGDWVNVYVVGSITNPSAGGYARFPYDPFGGYNIRGGVVLARGNMFLGTHTLAHELGHTFGLHHTFHGVDEVPACSNCYEDMGLAGQDTEGDWCSDTRPHPTNANICGDAGTDACSGLPWTGSPVNNHMSYSFCTSQFTPQQAGRMHCMIDSYLSNWVAYGNGTCGAQPPTANFFGTPTIWQAPMNVTFTDLSVPAPAITSWTWNFDVTGIGGVTPATWTGGPGVGDNPPVVEYTVCDTAYTVSLIVSNANGSDTLVRTNYITPFCPAGDCDTLFSHWNTPVSIPSFYSFAANDFVTGVPAPTLSAAAGDPIGFYEQYITPNPGVTTVGAVRVGLGNYVDPDSDMVIQVLVYNCDAAGTPVGAPLGGQAGINPGADLAVPGAGFFFEYWIPFNKVTVDSASFLVAVEIFPGDATDRLIVVSSQAGQGQNLGLNYTATTGFGYINYNTFVGIDFDLDIIPMLGEWPADPFINGLGVLQACDTTLVIITDSALFHTCMTSITFSSSQLGVSITDTSLAGLDTLFLLYTTPPPDTLTFTTINNCGRADTAIYFLTYPLDTTPRADFIMNPANPICTNAFVLFTGSPTGMANYFWDFGDGNTFNGGTSNTAAHTYATPGLYYVSLTVTDSSGCSSTETKLDFVEVIDCSVNAPIAGFDPQPDSVCLGDPITFVDTSQAVPDAATSWFWAFDDGNFSIQQNPTHTYANAGTYTVMLVAGNTGGTDTVFYQVTVQGLPCLLPAPWQLMAQPGEDRVVLSWNSLDASDISDYEVERSQDGRVFDKIGTRAHTEAVSPQFFTFTDMDVAQDREIYYRIRKLLPNGGMEFSNIQVVRLGDGADWLRVYPNPVNAGTSFVVDAVLESEGEVQVRLVDALGRTVREVSRGFGSGLGRIELDTQALPAGNYFLRVQTARGVEVVKVQVN